MIVAMLFVTTLVQPAADTNWWSTDGAKVAQIAEQNTCALYVFQQKVSVGFLWDKTALAGVVFVHEEWKSPPRETEAAVRIGGTWISAGSGIEWFAATEEKDAVMIPIRYYPVEALLSTASSVSLRHDGAELSIPLDKTKMRSLLQAVANCRRHLK